MHGSPIASPSRNCRCLGTPLVADCRDRCIMTGTTHALISLEERFAQGILDGTKKVELRRRPMRIAEGTTIWMYVKVPIGKVIGSAEVRSVHTLSPEALWCRYGDILGLSRTEFLEYLFGVERGFVLVLCNAKRLAIPVPLEQLRALNGSFQPPQFFQHLSSGGPLVAAFTNEVAFAPQARHQIVAHAKQSRNR